MSEPVKNIPLLIDAICEAYDDPHWQPRYIPSHGWITYCNEAVNFICKKFGYTKFDRPESPEPKDALLANRIDQILRSSGDWGQVSGDEAQDMANQGALVIATLANPSGHGHVCVIRPGQKVWSGTWNQNAPKCMNIGKENFIGKKASWAFRRVPDFFFLRDKNGR